MLIKAHLANICIVITFANILMVCFQVAINSMKYRKGAGICIPTPTGYPTEAVSFVVWLAIPSNRSMILIV